MLVKQVMILSLEGNWCVHITSQIGFDSRTWSWTLNEMKNRNSDNLDQDPLKQKCVPNSDFALKTKFAKMTLITE